MFVKMTNGWTLTYECITIHLGDHWEDRLNLVSGNYFVTLGISYCGKQHCCNFSCHMGIYNNFPFHILIAIENDS